MKRITLTGSALALLVAAIAIFYFFSPHSIEVAHPTRGPAVQAVYATGTVEATVMLPIAPRVTARLMELNVDEGSHVTKDQVMAQLEDEDVQQVIRELTAREEFTRAEYERYKKLLKSSVISSAQHDRVRSEWEAAQAALAKARAELEYTKLIAPDNGRVIRRDGEVGQLIPANQPVFWLSCCAPLRISAEVDEEDIALVQPGQKVLIRADAFPDELFHGEVQSITPKGDPVARSYRVRIGFTQNTPLLIGMTAETNIIIRETEEALLVPSRAIVHGNIWVVEGGKLARREVPVGAQGAEQTEILSGLTVNDSVVLDPVPSLKEGKKVRTHLADAEE